VEFHFDYCLDVVVVHNPYLDVMEEHGRPGLIVMCGLEPGVAGVYGLLLGLDMMEEHDQCDVMEEHGWLAAGMRMV